MDLSRGKPHTGVELLRNYIESPNDFEQDVFDALTAKGMKLILQFGVSQYRIDLAAEHTDNQGCMCWQSSVMELLTIPGSRLVGISIESGPPIGSSTSNKKWRGPLMFSQRQCEKRMRTDDELVKEMVDALSFARRGARIEARVRQAIRRAALGL